MHRNESKVKLEGLGIKNVQDLLRHVAKSKPGARCREQSGALSKGALTSFINKELGPAAWDIYNEALKTGQVEQGGTSPHEWVRSKLPAPPQTDEVVEQLEVSGQARERCVAALRRSNGDANAAAASPLLATSTSSAPTGGAASSSNPFAALCDTDPDDEDSDQEQPRPEASEAEPLPPRPMSTANPVPAAPPLQPPVPAPVLPKPSRSSSPDAPQPPSPSSPRAPTSLFPYDNFKPGYGDKLVWVTHQFASCDNYDFGKASPRSTAGLQDDKYMLAIRELKEKENLVVECWDDPDKNRRLNDVRLQHHVNYFLAHIFESHHVWIGEKKVKELAEQDGQAPAAARKLLKEKTNIEAFDEAKWPDKVHEFLHEYDLQLCDADFKDTQTGAFISSDYLKFGRGEDGKQWLVVRLDLTLDLSKDLAPIFVLFKQRDEPAKPADPQLPVGPCWDLKKFATLSECTGQDHFDDGTKRDIHRYAVIDWADHPPKLAPFRGKKVPWDGRITIEGLDNEHLMSDKESHRRVQKILDEIGIPHDSQQDYLKMKINLTRTLAESQPDLARVQHFREKRTDGTTRSVVQFVRLTRCPSSAPPSPSILSDAPATLRRCCRCTSAATWRASIWVLSSRHARARRTPPPTTATPPTTST